MKDFNYWKKLHEDEKLEEFSSDSIGLLWLKTKSIVRKELIAEFLKSNSITLTETALAKQFVELFDMLSKDIINSHKILNKVAALAGAEPGETITLAWTVASSRGINQKISKVSNKITVTRIEGLEDPGQVFITGEGSESGSNLANALPMHRLGEGEYEVYVKLVAGGTYKFVDSKSGSPAEYYIADGKLKEGTEGTANTLNGVYRIKIDFGSASASTPVEITEVGFWFCPTNSVDWKLSYQGKGVWKGAGPVTFKQESWGRDQRYKFRVSLKDTKGTESLEDWGPANANEDGTPSGTASYYNLAIYTSISQWDHKWKFASDFDGKTVNLTVKMTGDTYTHEVSL